MFLWNALRFKSYDSLVSKVKIQDHKRLLQAFYVYMFLLFGFSVCEPVRALFNWHLTHSRAFPVSIPNIRNSMTSYKKVHQALTAKESKKKEEKKKKTYITIVMWLSDVNHRWKIYIFYLPWPCTGSMRGSIVSSISFLIFSIPCTDTTRGYKSSSFGENDETQWFNAWINILLWATFLITWFKFLNKADAHN